MAEVLEQSQNANSVSVDPTATWDSTPTSGNILISVAVNGRNNTTPFVPPSGWTLAQDEGGTACGIGIAYKESDGTETTQQWTTAAAAGLMEIWIGEYSGLTGSTPVDSNTGTTGGSTATSIGTGTATATSSDTFAIVAAVIDNRASPTSGRAWTNSFVSFYTELNTISGGPGVDIASKTGIGSGSVDSTFSYTGSADQLRATIMLWDVASAAAGNPWNYYAQQ